MEWNYSGISYKLHYRCGCQVFTTCFLENHDILGERRLCSIILRVWATHLGGFCWLLLYVTRICEAEICVDESHFETNLKFLHCIIKAHWRWAIDSSIMVVIETGTASKFWARWPISFKDVFGCPFLHVHSNHPRLEYKALSSVITPWFWWYLF